MREVYARIGCRPRAVANQLRGHEACTIARMTIYARNVRASQLSLADDPPPSNGAAEAGTASLSMEAQDSSLADAEQEYATGCVDAPLWARALKQAGGDKAQATRIYLDRRAAALRAAKRNEDVPLP